MGVGIGAALTGLRPIVEFQFADFITSAFNQVVNNAGTMFFRSGMPLPLTIRCPSGANVHGGPFHRRIPKPGLGTRRDSRSSHHRHLTMPKA